MTKWAEPVFFLIGPVWSGGKGRVCAPLPVTSENLTYPLCASVGHLGKVIIPLFVERKGQAEAFGALLQADMFHAKHACRLQLRSRSI